MTTAMKPAELIRFVPYDDIKEDLVGGTKFVQEMNKYLYKTLTSPNLDDSLDSCADNMGMPRRSFQRRVRVDGYSFRSVRDQFRKVVTLKLLRDTAADMPSI